MQIENKRAVITGAAGGIGQAIAALYASAGARVFLVDRDAARLESVIAELGAGHTDQVHGIALDVTREEAVARMVDEAEGALGGIDVLVTCSGAITERELEDMSLAEWREIMGANLDAVFLACRAVFPIMKRQGSGRIITVSSQIGQRGAPRFTHYAASKAGVIGFTKALAREAAPHGILVNSVAPGPVLTSFNRDLRAETLDGTEAALPLGRAAQPEEIAGAALLLASSPHGDVFVGQTLGPNSGDVML
ncbi:SDR family NAD(P)-dependent oxidoreductase [Allosediminivita pacifica]|uniref:3-oxoacyl-[acyl-carrier protein] reductase n=1 Tax=Allosediminivita pacifica TaxID=1267769 RepID=A0A2T6AFZ0_9RHOB|nr:SDR family NAD(P)-dependent oxidoreductase [Allosediminivita pacifica]PTX42732.1 3-oxoacyl-[acyl-carrier protein] reductase [Allosediminivita pacifica]GGB06529.1 3-oxoacyl-ACP reductase [Allosediminivita pacifica]